MAYRGGYIKRAALGGVLGGVLGGGFRIRWCHSERLRIPFVYVRFSEEEFVISQNQRKRGTGGLYQEVDFLQVLLFDK